MKWKRFTDFDGIILFMVIPFIGVYASDANYSTCSSAVNVSKNFSIRNRIVNITVLFNKSTSSEKCTYVVKVPNILESGALKITTKVYSFLENATISESDIPVDDIQFSVSEVGSPVKILKNYIGGKWIIHWPWDTVAVTLGLHPFVPPVVDHGSSLEILLESRRSLTYRYISNRFSCYKKINLPYRRNHVKEYCLKNRCYKVQYTQQYQNERKYKKMVRFQIINKSVCIKADPGYLFYGQNCRWKIHLLVESKIVMVLGCVRRMEYWCLPASWFDNSDILEIHFVETGKNVMYLDSYTIHVMSDFSSSYDSSAQCRLGNPTMDYPTTKSPVEWSSWTYPAENYDHKDSFPSLGIVFPFTGVFVMILVCISCAYARHQNERRVEFNRQSSAGPQQYTDLDTVSNGSRIRNPAYRSCDPVHHTPISVSTIPIDRPLLTEPTTDSTRDTSYNNPPPDYIGLMAASSQSDSPPNYIELTDHEEYTPPSASPVPSEQTATLLPPPPSYEDALDMIDLQNRRNNRTN